MAAVQEILIDGDVLKAVDLSPAARFCAWSPNFKYFQLESGKEHYRLLAHLARSVARPTVLDIGTYQGMSAAALSIAGDKRIETFDLVSVLPQPGTPSCVDIPNVRFSLGPNYLSDLPQLLPRCDLVVLDIDHNGNNERDIIDRLEKAGFDGLLLLDDIYLNDAMRRLWQGISQPKIDLTGHGHWSGTGLVVFAPERFKITVTPATSPIQIPGQSLSVADKPITLNDGWVR